MDQFSITSNILDMLGISLEWDIDGNHKEMVAIVFGSGSYCCTEYWKVSNRQLSRSAECPRPHLSLQTESNIFYSRCTAIICSLPLRLFSPLQYKNSHWRISVWFYLTSPIFSLPIDSLYFLPFHVENTKQSHQLLSPFLVLTVLLSRHENGTYFK